MKQLGPTTVSEPGLFAPLVRLPYGMCGCSYTHLLPVGVSSAAEHWRNVR